MGVLSLFLQMVYFSFFKIFENNLSHQNYHKSCRKFLQLQSGELVVDVKKLKKDSSFVFKIPIVACGIRGTNFDFPLLKNDTI